MASSNKRPSLSFLFVLVQFMSLGIIVITGKIIPSDDFLLAIEILGIALGIWAVLTMRLGNFNITPDPLAYSKLVMGGPYSLIRHPMYLALLLTTLPLVIDSFSLVRLMIWLILFTNLILKLNYEENLLVTELDGYVEYAKKSYRLIPFVY